MLTVGDIRGLLSGFALNAASWDKVGLQLGDPSAPVSTLAVCHEVTDEVVDKAIAEGVDLLVAYHPLLFAPTTNLVAGATPAGRAHRLIAAGIALFVVHTGWDVVDGGTADSLAAAFGLDDVRPFGADDSTEHFKVVTWVPDGFVETVTEALAGAGAGTIGRYTACSFAHLGSSMFTPSPSASPYSGRPGVPGKADEQRVEMIAPLSRKEAVLRALLEVHPYEDAPIDLMQLHPRQVFIGRIGTTNALTLGELETVARVALDFDGIRRAGASETVIRTVAVVPGSGSSFIGAAAAAGADVLITGDAGHHRAVEALGRGVALLDVGHAPGERPGMRALYAAVCDTVELPVHDFTAINTNPWETP